MSIRAILIFIIVLFSITGGCSNVVDEDIPTPKVKLEIESTVKPTVDVEPSKLALEQITEVIEQAGVIITSTQQHDQILLNKVTPSKYIVEYSRTEQTSNFDELAIYCFDSESDRHIGLEHFNYLKELASFRTTPHVLEHKNILMIYWQDPQATNHFQEPIFTALKTL